MESDKKHASVQVLGSKGLGLQIAESIPHTTEITGQADQLSLINWTDGLLLRRTTTSPLLRIHTTVLYSQDEKSYYQSHAND